MKKMILPLLNNSFETFEWESLGKTNLQFILQKDKILCLKSKNTFLKQKNKLYMKRSTLYTFVIIRYYSLLYDVTF